MDLRKLQSHWHRLGEVDPLHAVLTEGEQWEIDAFFETGRAEVEQVRDQLRTVGLDLPGGRALDFGCGVGRVTQALAAHFDQTHGVDIARSMLELARKHNGFGSRVVYHLNEAPNLAMFDDGAFDFVYTARTLQHMEPRFAKGYLVEFLRILRPGGLLFFQLTAEPRPAPTRSLLARAKWAIGNRLPKGLLDAYRSVRYRRPWMEMYGVPVDEVVSLLEARGGHVLEVYSEDAPGWLNARYVVKAA